MKPPSKNNNLLIKYRTACQKCKRVAEPGKAYLLKDKDGKWSCHCFKCIERKLRK